ncbi:MAG: hypothetical protein V1802_02000 [Candidatus Aenigmatarchaeota archaeon]
MGRAITADGKVWLDPYLTPPFVPDENYKKYIEALDSLEQANERCVGQTQIERIHKNDRWLIDELSRNKENISRYISQRKKILAAQEKYPVVDLSFLGMSNTRQFDDMCIDVPRFTVHRMQESGIFQLRFFSNANVTFVNGSYGTDGYIGFGDNEVSVPSNFSKYLSLSMENHRHRRSEEVGKKYRNLSKNNTGILCSISQLVIAEAMETTKDAAEYFGQNLYLIVETQPKEWILANECKSYDARSSKITAKPLVIGFFDHTIITDLIDTSSYLVK